MTCLVSDKAAWTLLQAAAAEHGLLLRGGFRPEPDDGVPALSDGRPAAALVLLGNAGPDMFARFRQSPEAADGLPDPLDRWTRRAVGAIARNAGAMPVLPFDGPPWHPFQRWATRAEPVAPSPTGMLIHPDYGLWHAYRGALLFAGAMALPPRRERPSPCSGCTLRPCLSACPVGAFTQDGYDVARCRTHVAGPSGGQCRETGCRARSACPVGQRHRPTADQAAFHMAAFVGSPSG